MMVTVLIPAVEEDEDLGCYLVGRGGLPTSAGHLELDAAVMDGKTAKFGAVASLQGVPSAFPVARLVMEKSPHSMIVGSGAADFARTHNVQTETSGALLGKRSRERYQKFLQGHRAIPEGGHDTLGLITLDADGNIAVGVATSGMPFKAPGRVGDSPLPGPGLFADGRYGAACATGDGDDILRFSPSSRVVTLMASLSPQEACHRVIQDIAEVWRRVEEDRPLLEMGIIAMNTTGEYGAATTIASWKDDKTGEVYPGFPYAVWSQASDSAERVETVTVEKL